MPINEDPFTVFLLCRNALLRGADGKPHDIDINALSTTVLAMKCEPDTVLIVANLMRQLLEEELI